MTDAVDILLHALAGLQPAVLYLRTGAFMTLESSPLIGLLPGTAWCCWPAPRCARPRDSARWSLSARWVPARRVDRQPAASWRHYGERFGLAGLAVLAVVALAAWSLRVTRRRRSAVTRREAILR